MATLKRVTACALPRPQLREAERVLIDLRDEVRRSLYRLETAP